MTWSPPTTEAELVAPCESNETSWRDGRGYTFTLERRESPEPVGRIVIRREEGLAWNIGFWTHPLHQGKGYMTEAAIALLRFGFAHLEATEIRATHAAWNIASRRVLERAGFRFINHVPEGFMKNGRWVEEDRLSISREQWEQGAGQANS